MDDGAMRIVAMLAALPARRAQEVMIGTILAVAIVAGVVGGATNTAAVGLL